MIERLSKLAHLALSAEEKERLEADIEMTLEYINQLHDLDTMDMRYQEYDEHDGP